MFKRLQGLVIGILIGSLLTGSLVFAANNQYLEALYNNIKIVIDGKEIHPTDASGGNVEPFIVNGTTYLPVRAVSEAFGKAVQWDGPTYTVYIGDMDGKLEYPTVRLEDMKTVNGYMDKAKGVFKNNYEATYNNAVTFSTNTEDNTNVEYLLNMKYSKIKGTIVVPYGAKSGNAGEIVKFEVDGKIIWTSPEIKYDSRPISFDINITGCNKLKIIREGYVYYDYGTKHSYFADSGFYQ